MHSSRTCRTTTTTPRARVNRVSFPPARSARPRVSASLGISRSVRLVAGWCDDDARQLCASNCPKVRPFLRARSERHGARDRRVREVDVRVEFACVDRYGRWSDPCLAPEKYRRYRVGYVETSTDARISRDERMRDSARAFSYRPPPPLTSPAFQSRISGFLEQRVVSMNRRRACEFKSACFPFFAATSPDSILRRECV